MMWSGGRKTLLAEIMHMRLPNEEEAETTTKIDRARTLFKGMISNPDVGRADIIGAFEEQLGVTNSTAVSYFQRIAKDLGLTNMGADNQMVADDGGAEDDTPDPVEDLPDEQLDLDDEVPQSDDPDRQGVIRTVPNAHLVYKRENEEGTFDELWIYNVQGGMSDEMKIRRAILAGTDIPPRKTKSEDGNQQYQLTTMGNAQLLSITGLPQ